MSQFHRDGQLYPYHCDPLGHVIRAVRGVRPRFDHHRGAGRELKPTDFGLGFVVGQTGLLHFFVYEASM